MIRCLAGLLLLLLAQTTRGTDSLCIGTWNVRNYLLQNRFVHGNYRIQYPKPEIQKAGLRESILTARPDVLFLQELGADAFLIELQADLAACGLIYPYRHWAQVPDNRTGLAVLSRIPFDSAIFHDVIPVGTGFPQATMPRGIQEIRLTFSGHAIRCFHLHLKSRFSSDPGDPESRLFRTAELAALSRFLDETTPQTHPGELLLLVGDFNAPFTSYLLDPLRANWSPVPARDPQDKDWTYTFHKTQSHERIDGFWTLRRPSPVHAAARILPAPSPPPSDHRLLLLELAPCTP